jgi:hypothetical protein
MSFHQIHILLSLVVGLVFQLYIDYISLDRVVVEEEVVVVEEEEVVVEVVDMDNIPCIAQTVLACYNLHISTYRNLDMSIHQIRILLSLELGLVFPLYKNYIVVDNLHMGMDIDIYIVQTVLACYNLHISTYKNLHMSFHQIHILLSLVVGLVFQLYIDYISLDRVVVEEEVVVVEEEEVVVEVVDVRVTIVDNQTVLACYNLHISTYRNLDMSIHQIRILLSLVVGLVFLLYRKNNSLHMVLDHVE